MKKVSLRTALKALGCSEISLRWNGGVGARDQSGFFTGGGKHGFVEGQTYYVSYSPTFSCNGKTVMYRTTEHRKDCHGGQNCWDFNRKLNEIGLCMDGKASFKGMRWG